jgi:long-chain acyl-CoA synthetase
MNRTLNTLNDIFFNVVERNSPCVAMYKQTVKWIPISSQEFYRDVSGVARALLGWGIAKGDRVAILSENRPEWAAADFACLLIGAVVVPIYPTLTAEQTRELLIDSGARVIFASTIEQMEKVEKIQKETAVEKVVVMDYVGVSKAIPMHRIMQNLSFQRDPELDERGRAIQPGDIATIIYTSGTTGKQKGAVLTHGNMASNVSVSLETFGLQVEHDSAVSFLPLSHVTARHVDYGMYHNGVTIAYCPYFDRLPQYLLEIRPTLFVGVPRVFEKVYNKVQEQTASGIKRSIYHWALQVGRANRDQVLRAETPTNLSWKLADRLMFRKLRAGFGGRVKYFISGGAPLGKDLAAWYADMSIRIHEGYGLTETSPVIAVNNPKSHRLGSVGPVLPNLEVKIADDGEVLVKGPSVFQGYWNRPEETQAAFQGEWFRTGDVGEIDADGFLFITDRKKDLIKTSGGKAIAPQPVETALKTNPLVAGAVVIGEARNFPAVVISPHFPLLEDWARTNRIEFHSREELVGNEKVRALYDGIVNEVNASMAQFERLKKVLIVPDEFTIENGLLTASMKLRRREVVTRYKEQIDRLYNPAGTEAAPVR